MENRYPGLPDIFQELEIELGGGVGKGWWHIIVSLHLLLKVIDPGYQISQIKEKYGGLRYYWDPSDGLPEDKRDAMLIAEEFAEFKSSYICEECGAPGKNRVYGGYWTTRCEDHAPGISRSIKGIER